ncbi:MAG: LysR family transcriptional regulator [Bacteroidota bacterium]
MELKYFRLIKTIAEQGNIANSSEQLFLTQSALSHQLREMEDRLGWDSKFFTEAEITGNSPKRGKSYTSLPINC